MSKFKGGDKVKCLNRNYGNETEGKVYTLHPDKHFASGRFYIEKDDNGNKNSYKDSDFELVKEVRNKFKVGDKVRITRSKSGFCSKSKVGDTATVINVYYNDCDIQLDSDGIMQRTLYLTDIELVKPLFKKGDLIRALETSANESYIKGRTYKVKKDCIGENEYTDIETEVDSNGSTTNGWNNEFFELVSKEDDIDQLIEEANKGYQALVALYDDHNGKFDHYSGESLIAHYNYHSVNKIVKKQKEFKLKELLDYKITVEANTIFIGCKKFDLNQLQNILHGLCFEKDMNRIIKSIEAKATRSGIEYDGYNISWEEADKLLAAIKEYTK